MIFSEECDDLIYQAESTETVQYMQIVSEALHRHPLLHAQMSDTLKCNLLTYVIALMSEADNESHLTNLRILAEILLQNGANPNLLTSKKETASDFLIRFFRKIIDKEFQSKEIINSEPLESYKVLTSYFLQQKANFDFKKLQSLTQTFKEALTLKLVTEFIESLQPQEKKPLIYSTPDNNNYLNNPIQTIEMEDDFIIQDFSTFSLGK